MAEETSNLEAKIAALHSKVERESRFTRSLVVICTAAILGVSLVPVKIMLSDLPSVVWAKFEENLQIMHQHWNLLDRAASNSAANSSAANNSAANNSAANSSAGSIAAEK